MSYDYLEDTTANGSARKPGSRSEPPGRPQQRPAEAALELGSASSLVVEVEVSPARRDVEPLGRAVIGCERGLPGELRAHPEPAEIGIADDRPARRQLGVEPRRDDRVDEGGTGGLVDARRRYRHGPADIPAPEAAQHIERGALARVETPAGGEGERGQRHLARGGGAGGGAGGARPGRGGGG